MTVPVAPIEPEASYLGGVLAETLAALCNGLHQVLEAGRLQAIGSDGAPPPFSQAEMMARIQSVRNRRPTDLSDLPAEHRTLWMEIDKLVTLVEDVCSNPNNFIATAPRLLPNYDDVVETKRQQRLSRKPSDLSSLNDVLTAIDRVLSAAPRMLNQSVSLTDRQEQRMAAATLVALIERLLAGREEFQAQRATVVKRPSKHQMLNNLIDQIASAGNRSYADQRVELSTYQKDFMDFVRLIGVIEHHNQRRFENQDWESQDVLLHRDLEHIQTLLSDQDDQLVGQRFVLSESKNKDMFLNGVIGKLWRMSERRMGNQDAVNSKTQREDSIEEN
ncbi:hypothetical protein HK101_006064 [Irineochytrium annulatum]|nr:hypothetical protein HK101_006064 [Irineochytrium annulatum]